MAVNLRVVGRFTHGVIAPDEESANKKKDDQRGNNPLCLWMRAEEPYSASVLDGAALFAGPVLIALFWRFNFRVDRVLDGFFFLIWRNLNRVSHVIFLPGMLASAAPPRPGRAPAKAWLYCSDTG